LRLETRPPATGPLRLQFALRSLTPRTVTLTQDGHEVWRGETNLALTRHAVELPSRAAPDSVLEFSSPAPAIAESPAPGARALSFALYDLRLALPEP
ncbi:MAG: hypothetical protein ABIQ12_13815, partial [Opitutaceae bacterium]